MMLTLLASSPAPTKGTRYPDPSLVTPGTLGFLFVLLIVVLTIFLIRDAMRRVRRVRARDHAENVYPIPMAKSQKRRYRPETRTAEVNDSFVPADPEAAETADASGTGGAQRSGGEAPDDLSPGGRAPRRS